MKTEGTNLLVLTISALWSSSRWAPEGRQVSHKVVVIDRFHYMSENIVQRKGTLGPPSLRNKLGTLSIECTDNQ